MSVDLNKAGMLLHIASKARDWPNLRGLHDIVMAELEDMARQSAQELANMRAEAQAKEKEGVQEQQRAYKAALEREAQTQKEEAQERKAEFERAKLSANKVPIKEAEDKATDPQPLLIGGNETTTDDVARRL